MRDRFEVSLEPRQVALLFVLVLVILVLVFALGIIVGRGLRSPVTPPSVAGAAPAEEGSDEAEGPPLDAAALPGDPVEGEADGAPKLKFYGTDGKTPEREADAVAAAPQGATEAADTAPAPDLKGLPAEPAPAKQVAKAAEKPAEKPKAKADKPKAETKKTAKADKPKSSGGKFTIQVSAFQNRGQADHLVSNLKNKGYDAYIAQAVIPGKGIWYRVRIGNFGSRDDAQKTANTLKRKEGISTYVTLR